MCFVFNADDSVRLCFNLTTHTHESIKYIITRIKLLAIRIIDENYFFPPFDSFAAILFAEV